MSRFHLALSSFCFFLGVSLLVLGALAMPQHAFADYDQCMTQCGKDNCMTVCNPDPTTQACKDCYAACQQKCAQQVQRSCGGVCLGAEPPTGWCCQACPALNPADCTGTGVGCRKSATECTKCFCVNSVAGVPTSPCGCF